MSQQKRKIDNECPKDAPEDEVLAELADLFKIFADSTRIRILYVLFDGELCVHEIEEALCLGQSAVSHQLRVLKQSKLIKGRRAGTTIYYSLADTHVKTIFDQGLEHVTE